MPRVVSGFKCPYTNRIYHFGDEYDGEYLDEMLAKGYIEDANEKKEPESPEKPKKSKKNKE